MARLIHGERVGRQGRLMVGCSAVVFDAGRERVLLTRRADNGRWCLPGGRLEPGESAAEACAREVWEETGLEVEVTRLLGVYTSPHLLVEYPDGSRYQIVAINLEMNPVGGELRLSEETTGYGYFSLAEMGGLDVMESHLERIQDALTGRQEAFIK